MKQTLARIVVGVDGSDNAHVALVWASELAKRHDARIEALRAHTHPISPLVPAFGIAGIAVDQLVEPPRAQLRAAVAGIETDIAITETVVMRSAQFALEQASETAGLVVVGRTGRSRLENLFVGSTAGYCVHRAQCPVALIGPKLPTADVIVAVDGSERSVRALLWALAIWPASAIVAVYSHDESVLDDLGFDHEQRMRLEMTAQSVLAGAVAAACTGAQIPVSALRAEIRSGDPRTTIVGALSDDELLVLGTQGHSGLAGWMLGSLADYAVHNAAGSVIVHR